MTAFILLMNLQSGLGSRWEKGQGDGPSLLHPVSAGISWEFGVGCVYKLVHSLTCLAPGLGTPKVRGAGAAGLLPVF